jgi:hypothetical protein
LDQDFLIQEFMQVVAVEVQMVQVYQEDQEVVEQVQIHPLEQEQLEQLILEEEVVVDLVEDQLEEVVEPAVRESLS